MSAMGFSRDPGPLPFVTIRDEKWANRLVELPMTLRIHGERGCAMPRAMGLVTKIERYAGAPPAHLAGLYAGKALVAVHIDQPAPCAGPHSFDREWGMCWRCGAPEEETQ